MKTSETSAEHDCEFLVGLLSVYVVTGDLLPAGNGSFQEAPRLTHSGLLRSTQPFLPVVSTYTSNPFRVRVNFALFTENPEQICHVLLLAYCQYCSALWPHVWALESSTVSFSNTKSTQSSACDQIHIHRCGGMMLPLLPLQSQTRGGQLFKAIII